MHLWAGFVDSNPEISEYKGERCRRPDEIDPEQYFIIFALRNHYDEIHELLLERGYQEEKDYFYWFDQIPGEVVVTQVNGYYCDNFGNEIVGNIKGCSITIRGRDNLVVLDGAIKGAENLQIKVCGDCFVHIGENVKFIAGVTFIAAARGVSLSIGKGMSISYGGVWEFDNHMYMHVGNDCMFSHDSRVRAGNGHPLYYMNEGVDCFERDVETKMIYIGDHVWIGQGVRLLSGTHIGSGSVVGMGALVSSEFPSNCSIVGVPAKIARTDVAWIRDFRLGLSAEDLEEFVFT